jgi:hypothetical protein
MASCPSYTVNGFSFRVMYGMGFADGITIDPDEAELHNPDWIEAFEVMRSAYPSICAFITLDEGCSYALYNADMLGLSSIDSYLRDIAEFKTSGHYGVIAERDRQKVDNMVTRLVNARIRAEQPKPAANKIQKNGSGFVYLLQSPSSAYKIGRAKDPANRAKTFGVQLPFEVEFIALIKTDDMYTLELELHAQYASKHINGEWFALDAADVEAIKALAVQA